MSSEGWGIARESLRGTDMILTTHGNRRVPSTSVKITSGGIREVRIGRYRARSEPWFVVARKRKASAYSAAPREKTDLSTNYQLPTNQLPINQLPKNKRKEHLGRHPMGNGEWGTGEWRNRPQGKNDETTNLRKSTQIKKRCIPISRLKICADVRRFVVQLFNFMVCEPLYSRAAYNFLYLRRLCEFVQGSCNAAPHQTQQST